MITPTESFVQIGQNRLHVERIAIDKGDKHPTLVFLHDAWGCVSLWRGFARHLCNTLNCNGLLYDRTGHGLSGAQNAEKLPTDYHKQEAILLNDLLGALHLTNVVLYGHSDGATIALIAASLFRDKIKGIVLESAHCFSEEDAKIAIRETVRRAKTSNLINKLELHHGTNAKALFERWHRTWLSDEFKNWSITSALSEINCPAIAFQGEDDQYETLNQLRTLEEEMQSPLTTYIIPKAGHTPRNENTDFVLSIIKKWFDENF